MKKNSIYSVTSSIIYKLNALSEISSGKSYLAKLRNSIGKDISSSSEVWSILFENLPEEFLGDENRITTEERVITLTLQLFALMNQGSNRISVNPDDENKYKNIGYSIRVLRDEHGESVDRRFNALLTSSDVDELSTHLRYLLNLLKAKTTGTYVNFPKLAEDMYWYSKGYGDSVKLSWAREYYRKKKEFDNEK